MYQIRIDDLVIDVIRKRIKNMYLKISRTTGEVKLSVPLNVNEHAARNFIRTKLSWIEKHKNQSPKNIHKITYQSGEYHYYQGKAYCLNIIPHQNKPKIILRDQSVIDLYTSLESDEVKRKQILGKWYGEKLKVEIPLLLEKWQSRIGEALLEWRIKYMKTRWGSCNVKARRIWFNVELAKYPVPCLEYVVVHELVHLLEQSHNKRFKTLMDRYLPDWRDRKRELNELSIRANQKSLKSS